MNRCKFRANATSHKVRKGSMRYLATAVTVLFFSLGCGGSSSTATSPTPSPQPPPAPTPTPPTPTPAPATNIAGNWTLTITASTICTPAQVPAALRRRTYSATITQSGADVVANLTGQFSASVVRGRVSGNTVSWFLYLLETVSSDILGFVNISGSAATTGSDSTMSGPLDGSYIYGGASSACSAVDHQLSFAR